MAFPSNVQSHKQFIGASRRQAVDDNISKENQFQIDFLLKYCRTLAGMFAFDSHCDNRCVQETRNCQKKNYSLEGIQKLSKQPYSGHVLSTAIAIKLFCGIWYSQSYDAENDHECICRPIFSSALWMIWMLSCNAGRSLLINVTNWNNRWWMAMINCIDPVLVLLRPPLQAGSLHRCAALTELYCTPLR